MKDVRSNPINGAVSFINETAADNTKLRSGIGQLGYHVAGQAAEKTEPDPG